MDAIKLFLISLIFIPTILFGQKSLHPKDIIYVKYETKKDNKKWHTKYSLGGLSNKQKISWIDKKFKGLKYKPYNASRNGVFQTYIIEVISKGYFVIYTVIWTGEGVTD